MAKSIHLPKLFSSPNTHNSEFAKLSRRQTFLLYGILIYSNLFYLQHSPLVYPFETITSDYLPIYKSCSFIKSWDKPTINSTTLQQHHDNNKIESHNHNKHLLLYKEVKIFLSRLGRFLECRKWNILVLIQARVLCLIYVYALALGHALHISNNNLYVIMIPGYLNSCASFKVVIYSIYIMLSLLNSILTTIT